MLKRVASSAMARSRIGVLPDPMTMSEKSNLTRWKNMLVSLKRGGRRAGAAVSDGAAGNCVQTPQPSQASQQLLSHRSLNWSELMMLHLQRAQGRSEV